jgi:putative tryptophan/tyrosine transport system substrate-binding protein
MGKWLGLLKQMAPRTTRVAIIFNPDTTPWAGSFNSAIEGVAPSFGVTVTRAPIHDDAEIDRAIADFARQPGGGLVIMPEAFAIAHRDTIVVAAARNKLPTIGMNETLPKAGGLMSYSVDPVTASAQAASYVDRILRGAKPADLPVQYPTQYQLLINLKTANALGLTIPETLLATADEVIQ